MLHMARDTCRRTHIQCVAKELKVRASCVWEADVTDDMTAGQVTVPDEQSSGTVRSQEDFLCAVDDLAYLLHQKRSCCRRLYAVAETAQSPSIQSEVQAEDR
jgi:hypothetical protein